MAVRTSRSPVIRGCGQRKAGGVYLCTGTSEHGVPIEDLFVDPVQSFKVECFRAPVIVDDPNIADLKHIAIWVGKEHYPSIVDFIEETRRLGVSRRVPEDFDFSGLTPGLSRMFLIHSAAFTERIVPVESCPHESAGHGVTIPCISAHWQYAQGMGSLISGDDQNVSGKIGNISYKLPTQLPVDLAAFSPGAFLQLPITHIEYQAHHREDVGSESVNQRAIKAGFNYVIVDDAT